MSSASKATLGVKSTWSLRRSVRCRTPRPGLSRMNSSTTEAGEREPLRASGWCSGSTRRRCWVCRTCEANPRPVGRGEVSARSAPPADNRWRDSAQASWVRVKRTPGYSERNPPRSVGTTSTPSVGRKVRATRPSSVPVSSATPRLRSSRARSTWGRSTRPARVSRIPRPVRSTRAIPNSSWSRAKALLNVGWGVSRAAAACVTCSVRATSEIIRRRGASTRVSASTSGLSIHFSMQQRETMHWTYERTLSSVDT